MKSPKFCPTCASELESRFLKDRDRLVCSADCGYVHWNNPTPVIAAIVEAFLNCEQMFVSIALTYNDEKEQAV